jgi:hypothetical protein
VQQEPCCKLHRSLADQLASIRPALQLGPNLTRALTAEADGPSGSFKCRLEHSHMPLWDWQAEVPRLHAWPLRPAQQLVVTLAEDTSERVPSRVWRACARRALALLVAVTGNELARTARNAFSNLDLTD